MAYDSVLDREMFRPKSRGVVSLDDTNESEDLRSRREKAMAMIDAAKEKFDPKNFQTLTEQDRPGVFRPVAVNMPAQQPTADTAMRMQQMAAQGVRPVGMADGGSVYHFRRGGDSRDGELEPTVEPSGIGSLDISGPTMIIPGQSSVDPMGNYTGMPDVEMQEVPDTTQYPSRRSNPASLPSSRLPTEAVRGSDRTRGIISSLPPEEPKKEDKKKSTEDEDKHPTGIESIKAERARQREENFNMALIRAGLGIAAGKSSNALANIGEGGIAGLEQFARAEKEDRALAAEEKKYQEDRAARIQRAAELAQEKKLTRETRVYDIAASEIKAIDSEIRRLQTEMAGAMDDAQKATYQNQIADLTARRRDAQRVIQESLSRLGYEGSNIYSSEQGSSRTQPTIDYSGLPQR